MNQIDMDRHDAKAELETREAQRFEVQETAAEALEVVELESAPLTDINFGF